MKKSILLFCVCAFYLSNFSDAQITFEKTYGDTGEDYGTKIIQTADEGFLILTEIQHNHLGDGSLAIKTNEFGDTLWTKLFNSNFGFANSVVETSDQGFAFCGQCLNGTFISRYDSIGDSLWTKFYLPDTTGGPALSIIEDYSDHSLMLTGYSNRAGMGICCFPFVIRTDSIGNLLWENDISPIYSGTAYNIVQESANTFVISCAAIGGAPTHLLFRISSIGNLMSFSCLNYVSETCECRIIKTYDNGIVISGLNYNNYSCILEKLDYCGQVQWIKSFPFIGFAVNAIETKDRGFALIGATTGDSDLIILKTDSMGDSLWAKSFGGNNNEAGQSIVSCTDSGLAAVGYTQSYGAGNMDIYFIKTTYDGLIMNEKPITKPNSILSISPNPFNSNITIHFANKQIGDADLQIYNIVGEKVLEKRMLHETQSINLESLLNGIYFVSLIMEQQVFTQKIVKL